VLASVKGPRGASHGDHYLKREDDLRTEEPLSHQQGGRRGVRPRRERRKKLKKEKKTVKIGLMKKKTKGTGLTRKYRVRRKR